MKPLPMYNNVHLIYKQLLLASRCLNVHFLYLTIINVQNISLYTC